MTVGSKIIKYRLEQGYKKIYYKMELSELPVKNYELGNYNVSQNQLDKIAIQ